MVRRLKVYVYEEGDVPLVHDGPCKNIYIIEGDVPPSIPSGISLKGLITSCSVVMIG